MTTLAALPIPRRTLLATLLAGFAASAFAAPGGNVVISQVYGGGGNNGATWNRDYIELFNRSGAPVSLANMSVQYQSAAGTTWQAIALPNVSLRAGEYFLVTAGTNNAAVGANLPLGDQTGGINLSGTTGKVALSRIPTAMQTADGGTDVLDLVGFGSANRFETAVAPAPSNSTALHRADLGCTDTDNNSTDFSAVTPTAPRRFGTLHSCGGPVVAPIVLSCPAGIVTQHGNAITALLSATDSDSIVNSAVILSGAASGISLVGATPAGSAGGKMEVTLQVDASVAAGRYPVKVQFGNSDSQLESCTVNVSVAGEATISQIQGSQAASDYNGVVMTTKGVITAKVGSGFFLQDLNGDGDPSTSDAIFVFGAQTPAMVGDLVQVTGTVDEYKPSGATRTYTELKDVSAVTKLSAGHTIAPTNIGLPNADLASVEAMLVRFTTPLTVNQNKYLGGRGELTLAHGRRENPTNRFPAGSPEAAALAAENAANELVLDDGVFTTPATIPYLAADGTVRAGDTVTDLTGVLDFGAIGGGGAAFKLQPTETPVFSRTNPRLPAPSLPAGVKVASANVLNFFTTFTDGKDAWGRSGQGCTIGSRTSAGECRGADNMAEFERQRDKIVASLKNLDADVVGLMEIQNNGDIAATYLVEQLNAAYGKATYAVVPKPAATGTDAIRVAMIYKPAAVSLVGAALSDGDSVNNRPPMGASFKSVANGGKFSVIVNHFKSKASCGGAGVGDTDPGNGQGCWDKTRTAQAQRLATYFIPQVVAAANDPDVLVIGDLNAYGFENPINYLTGSAGLVNQIERFVRPHGTPYSYVFDGQSGYLDHALASASLSGQVAGAAEWHNNADEPEAIDYNLGDTPQDQFTMDPYRASDHDPVVISLALTPTFADISSSVKVAVGGYSINRLTGKYSGTVTITNTSGQAISGPLHFLLQGLPAGVTLDNKSGMQGASPYISLPNAAIAAGASVSVGTTFSNPGKVSITYSPKLFNGTF
ncbi:ExeM/NucH family extracellular endonuclease [Massilia sp. DD77]|uniref:ExeM/NucH family extracellular endonuclease n=1 Tax=Massilia sp. DD77 TaxID=3109349 RepID=UPI003000EE8B